MEYILCAGIVQATQCTCCLYILQLRLRSGFKTKADAPNDNDIQEAYARSGSGAILEFDDSSQGDVVDIANAVMLNCPFIFSVSGSVASTVLTSIITVRQVTPQWLITSASES